MNKLEMVNNTREEINWSNVVVGSKVDLNKIKKNGRHIRVEVYNVAPEQCDDYHA